MGGIGRSDRIERTFPAFAEVAKRSAPARSR